MALILAVSRSLAEGERLIRSGGWSGWGPISMLGHRIWGKRLGIAQATGNRESHSSG